MKLLGLLAAAALGLAAVTLAFAHAEPAQVKPGEGAVLKSPPTQVLIEMSQEMAREAGANDIQVLDAGGKNVATGPAVIDNNDRKKLTVALAANLPTGTYTVKWKTLSADDGDPADGSYTFTFDPSKPASPGNENVRPDLLGNGSAGGGATAAPSTPPPASTSIGGGSDSGVSWITVAAVGVAMLVVGSGGTWFLVQKRP